MSSALTTIALAAIQPLVDATIASAGRFVGTKIKKLKTDGVMRGLMRRAMEIGQVKTLLCLEKPLHIVDFYSPQYIEMPGGQRIEAGQPTSGQPARRSFRRRRARQVDSVPLSDIERTCK